jgi:tRNA nucleotidyltransferase/poly(A) polymerase
MTNLPPALKQLAQRPELKSLVSAFKAAFRGGEIYLVGGMVRDALLGRATGKDFDLVARNADGKDLEKFLKKHGRVNLVGKRFGVWKFIPRDGEQNAPAIDIALPRTENSFNSGGYRDVNICSDPHLPIEKDLSRRDFTVNAMALRLLPRPELVDPYGGQKDLRKKVLVTVGEPAERFREDFSRMLRGIRFACQLGFTLDPRAMGAIRVFMPRINDYRSTPDGNMRVVATEIIAREMVKAFVANPVRAFDLWYESGATEALIPELLPMRGCAQPDNHHSEGDVWEHTKLALSKINDDDFKKLFNGESATPTVVMATLFHDIGKPPTKQTPEEHGTDRIRFNGHDLVGAEMTAAIAKRLTLSSAEGYNLSTDNLAWIVRFHLFTLHGKIDDIRPNTLEKYFFDPNLPGRELLMTIYCDSMGTVPKDGIKPEHLRHLTRLMERIDELAATGVGRKLPPPLLDGAQIMKIIKEKPGPRIGEIINVLREAQLEGKIRNKKEAEKYLKNF